ncbi:Non-repetitive/WGA-negative nucleoporin C-terminal [Pyrenophora tritici-repentis]|uniref:Non-repetitive/WGA-negative nucleoporin C-terminal n=2 Tax=Pyrenophora tritici-repentis TaxID=45151 RepID=A0A922ST26_9PLEO|nr:Non-repetitive/WGA-negative nucleoporin C-terminal [Pyrenophora tritici-repentis]KAI1681317.1 Non-repetitive/WGA-negative nucleoporin C-terminal [Pyrenophora tritici-repentis]
MDHWIPVSNNINPRNLLNLPINHQGSEEPTPSPARSFACFLDSTIPPIMFSPEASIQSARSSLRNPRRRQRKDSDGPQQQRSRKRSKLNDDSFKDPAVPHMNGNGSALINGHAVQSPENSVVLVDMPVREKKTAPKRAPKEDTGSYLTKNANYSVKKLPGFPSALLRPSTPIYATALPSAGLALALTHERALVWDYSAPSGPTKVISLNLNFGLKSIEPLPLGAIVRNGPTNDYGVVALAPSTGKIGFWENIDSADTQSLYPQRQQGVEGFVKLYSGETITNLVDVDHAGYVLVFSSGRLAQLTLRDSQGRPNVTTAVLSAPNGSGGSFFSFKGLLGAAIRKTIASVKARTSQSKGHMDVISVTKNALFQTWDLSWSGQHNHQRDVDVHDAILSAVQARTAPEIRSQHQIQVLDFAIMDAQQGQEAVDLLVLVALSGHDSLDYFLLEVELSRTEGTINRTIPIRNFQQPQLQKEPTGTLLLPQPGHTAYVQFPGAMFVASLAQPQESPEAQLLADSGSLVLPFQDTVYFRPDVTLSGTVMDTTARKDKRATALIFAQQFGILQISALPPATDDEDKERLKVTARSKLEQATFFSMVPGNIIDFSVKSRFSFAEEETAQAALAISAGILSSSYDYLEKAISNMDEQFQKRATALQTLVSQLQTEYPPMSFQTKWQLLWHAEKLIAAHKLWNWYQDKLQDQQANPDAYPENILMSDIVRALNERYKTAINREHGETDSIRQFFLKDVDSIQTLIPWGWFYLRTFYMKEGAKETPSVMQRLSEGADVMLVVLETAFEFRQANIEAYGLESDSLDDGILKAEYGYDMLPQFWTSSHNIVSSLRSFIDVGRNLAVENYEEGYQELLAQKIGKDNPRLVKLGCQTHIERFQWALAQSDEKTRAMGRSLKDEWNNNVRPSHIMGLMEIGLATEGMKLAEQYHDMSTLVNLIWEETTWLESEKASTRSKMEQAESTVKLNRIKERIARYFEVYGDDWADAFYSKYIRQNQAGQLFTKEYLNQPALTRFLRAEPSRVRLGWINEVWGEKNYEAAAEALYEAGSKQETNSWCQRVELSMAKLALLCKKEAKPGHEQQLLADARREKPKALKVREAMFQSIEQQLEYTKIQEEVYERLLPIITGALDEDSAVDLLMAEFGQGRLRDRPAHQSILRQGLENLVRHQVIDPALMIDILTLMNADDSEDGITLLQGDEFIYAFRVLLVNWNNIHRTTRDGLVKLVWKRLLLKDDWATINNTKEITDAKINEMLQDTALVYTFRELGRLCAGNSFARVVLPKNLQELLGAGGTHGELCVRFAAEDLREPIIKDNLLDDDTLREHLDKNRLVHWFSAAYQAAKLVMSEQGKSQNGPAGAPMMGNGVAPETRTEAEADLDREAAGSDTFDGDDESALDHDDVEMRDL